MTIIDSLKTITSYPIPQQVLIRTAVARELESTQEVDSETFKTASYRLAIADLMDWLVTAPNVSEGGVSVSLSQVERNEYKSRARAIYRDLNQPQAGAVKFGYKGQDL